MEGAAVREGYIYVDVVKLTDTYVLEDSFRYHCRGRGDIYLFSASHDGTRY